MNNIILSIIVPVYNQEDLILKALNSIPSREDIEVILVNDASTDNTSQILQVWHQMHSHISKEIIFTKNGGNCVAKNRGYSEAIGKYITVLDSDDFFYTAALNKAIDLLYKREEDIIFINNKVNNGEVWTDETRVAPWCYFIKNSFLRTNNLKYDETMRRAGDYDLMQRINNINHSTWHMDLITYHYNYPRVGSIVWNYEHNVKV